MEDRRKKVLEMDETSWRTHVDDKLRAGDAWRLAHQAALEENTELTKKVAESVEKNAASTSELLTIFNGAKTGVSGFRWVGRNVREIVKFLYPFALLGGAIVALLHGKWPKWD